MATQTTIAIANRALVFCGASPITSLTEDSHNARAVNAVFEMCRQSILTDNRWTFSLTRSTLTTNSTENLFPWTYSQEGYVYDKPTDALRIWAVSEPNALWRVEGEYIISDTAGLGVLYTWDNTEPGLWRPKFITAFVDKLCSEICFMILNNRTRANDFLEKYEKISLPSAEAENSQTGDHQFIRDDEWLSAKYDGSGNPARSYS